MIQITKRTLPGYFQLCNCCGKEPRHILCRGRTNGEPLRAPTEPVERHQIECSCGRSTARFNTLHQAEQDWGNRWAQTALRLRTARRPRKAVA